MPQQKIVSRASLYDSDSNESEQESDQMEYESHGSGNESSNEASQKSQRDVEDDSEWSDEPHNNLNDSHTRPYESQPYFDFVEVDIDEEAVEKVSNDQAVKEDDEQPEEFDFPLFASSSSNVMKVSLKEDEIEKINNERPEAYYFAKYTDAEKEQFELAAVGFEDVYKNLSITESSYKCVDLDIHNEKIAAEALRSKIRNKKRRAGKRKREFIVGCRTRKLERARIEKKIKKEQTKLKYQTQYTRGKKKVFSSFPAKRSGKVTKAAVKPVFRTE